MQTTGFSPADILIPKAVDGTKWSVVACDQFTSEPDYWADVTRTVGDAPSTLHLILPELYLNRDDVDARIESINRTMRAYLDDGLFQCYPNSLFYIERTLPNGGLRRGLIGAVDLEQYDYTPGSQSLIRATEGTVLDRLPPRVKVRQNAPLELPHIQLLIDDPEDRVFGCIRPQPADCAYDVTLMQNAGRVKGFPLSPADCAAVQDALCVLAEPERAARRYRLGEQKPMLFAVGDGNHSLATAKQCYERLKASLPRREWERHPARYALVEVVNLQDKSLQFEPIHRVVFDVDPAELTRAFSRFCTARGTSGDPAQRVTVLTGESEQEMEIQAPPSGLTVGSVQQFLDEYLLAHSGRVDYIHGDDAVRRLAAEPNRVGFLLPALRKDDLFRTVLLDGVLPRKTFSMGEALDKRFYLEARKIR